MEIGIGGAVTSLLILFVLVILWTTRPRLNPHLKSNLTLPLGLEELKQELYDSERRTPNLIPGTEATIDFANPSNPTKTDLVFMYVHGFSASWRETAPVAETLAKSFRANILQCRLAGHGTGPEGMKCSAEDWLLSLDRQAQIAEQLGEKIVVIAVSTGAPLSVWLATHSAIKAKLACLLFMSPNFKIRPNLGFLLTGPVFSQLIKLLFGGRYRSWVPANEEQAKFWTTKQPMSALVEMQKVVDWANAQDLESLEIPLATLYMPNDPTINARAAMRTHKRFSNVKNELTAVAIDGDKPDHVFCGDICGEHRTQWTTEYLENFLTKLDLNESNHFAS